MARNCVWGSNWGSQTGSTNLPDCQKMESYHTIWMEWYQGHEIIPWNWDHTIPWKWDHTKAMESYHTMELTNLSNEKVHTTNFCNRKMRTLQINKGDNTKFCSLKKRTLQTFVMEECRSYKAEEGTKAKNVSHLLISKFICIFLLTALIQVRLQNFVVSTFLDYKSL